MFFSRGLLLGASMFTAALAQTPIAFTTLPGASVAVGQSVQLAWAGGDGSAVAITLKQGSANSLVTVALINGDITGTSYTWIVPSNLPDATNYALQIVQGVNDINYSGQFAITGSTATSTLASSTASASSSAATAIIVAGPSGTNSTVTGAVLATTTIGTGASAGTGTTMSRNTTFSSQMLSTTSGMAATTGGVVAGTPTGTTGGSATGSSASSTPTGGASNVAGSSLALVLCAVVGMFVLN